MAEISLRSERCCPRCRGVALKLKRVEGSEIEIDQCLQCGGLWFDAGELEDLLGDLAAKPEEMPLGMAQYSVLCPACRAPLTNGNYPGTYVRIDYCRECGGIWLDKDEFNEIYTVRERKQENPALGEVTLPKPNRLEAVRMRLQQLISDMFSSVDFS